GLTGGDHPMRLGRALPLLIALLCAPGCLIGNERWEGGIMAVLSFRAESHALVVARVPAGGTAALGGLRPGDHVLSIDGAPVSAMTRSEVLSRLRGEVGSHVSLGIERAGTLSQLSIER